MANRLRRLALLALSLPLLASCVGDITETDLDGFQGRYVLAEANGAPAPALLEEITVAETGQRFGLYVVADTLTLDGQGGYVQHAQMELLSQAGQLVGRQDWTDRGSYYAQGQGLHFASQYLENVSFHGVAGGDGHIAVEQDISGEGNLRPFVLAPADR